MDFLSQHDYSTFQLPSASEVSLEVQGDKWRHFCSNHRGSFQALVAFELGDDSLCLFWPCERPRSKAKDGQGTSKSMTERNAEMHSNASCSKILWSSYSQLLWDIWTAQQVPNSDWYWAIGRKWGLSEGETLCRVVNDNEEQSVKLIQEFSSSITKMKSKNNICHLISYSLHYPVCFFGLKSFCYYFMSWFVYFSALACEEQYYRD